MFPSCLPTSPGIQAMPLEKRIIFASQVVVFTFFPLDRTVTLMSIGSSFPVCNKVFPARVTSCMCVIRPINLFIPSSIVTVSWWALVRIIPASWGFSFNVLQIQRNHISRRRNAETSEFKLMQVKHRCLTFRSVNPPLSRIRWNTSWCQLFSSHRPFCNHHSFYAFDIK